MEWPTLPLAPELLLFGSELGLMELDAMHFDTLDMQRFLQCDDVLSVCSNGTDDSGNGSPSMSQQDESSTASTIPSSSIVLPKSEPVSASNYRPSTDSAISADETNDTDEPDRSEPEALRRRRAHLASEKKRRNNLKDAFDEIKDMIPQCRNFPHSKNSKEAVLRKACDYIRYLHIQRAQMAEEIKNLRETVAKNGIEVSPPSSSAVKVADQESNDRVFPPGAKMLVLLALVDAFYETFMSHVSVRSPEEFNVTLLTFFQQHCTPEKLHAVVLGGLHSMVRNFSPITDGSSCRIRKWLDALNMCNVSAFDENVSTRVRGILNSVLSHFAA